MPTLDWIGKKAVVNHHRDVPYRLIHCDKDKSVGDPDAGNLLVQGDNLEALKALLPYYAGKVKCIYIDPPYNTGNEGWVYNDNVNSPEIRAWLGSVVGKEAEDLSRHDKWLCMMYPRLRLLKEFLREDGSIWISIDDNEGHYLKVIMDDLFGRKNFIADIAWKRRDGAPNDRKIGAIYDHTLVYGSEDYMNLMARTEKADSQYKLYEEPFGFDERGPFRKVDSTGNAKGGRFVESLIYPVTNPFTGEEVYPRKGRCWVYHREVMESMVADRRFFWGKAGRAGTPMRKLFKTEAKTGMTASTIWDDVGLNQHAARELEVIFGEKAFFETPKPEGLLKRVIEIATQPNDIVLDSFSGSGTTGAVAHKMGRKHISVEMGEHAHTHIVPRYRKVIEGEQGGISADVGWQGGGGFRFCTLGEPLFDSDGNVSPAVAFPELAAHVFFCETGSPIPRRATSSTPLIGTFQNRAIYLLHNAEAVGVPIAKSSEVGTGSREDFASKNSFSANAGNVLTGGVLDALPLPEPGFAGARIVYGEGCTVPDERLSRLGVTFKQIPYQIEGL